MRGVLINYFQNHAPIIKKRVKGSFCPWLTEEIKLNMNNRDKLLRKARKSKNDHDWKSYKRLKNTCTNSIRKARNDYHKDLLLEHSQDPKRFWSQIKQIFPCKSNKNRGNTPPFIDNSNTTHSSKANAFCRYFSTIHPFAYSDFADQ